MNHIITTDALTKRFGGEEAVSSVSLALEPGRVYGLLGRNGAGKSTLMRLLTGQEFATSGTIRVFGETPVENAGVLDRVCFIKETQSYPDAFRARHVLANAPHFFRHWDQAYADRLVDLFEVPMNRHMKKLSRGQRSAVGAIVGLASRAELTLFDEPYAGLDAVARRAFYDALLEDIAEHPRTVLFSTHLIDEAADLLEHVIAISHGRIVLDADADELRGAAATVAGPAAAVEDFVSRRESTGVRRLGGLATSTVTSLDTDGRAAARAAGLDLTEVSLQDLVIARLGADLSKDDLKEVAA